MKIVLVMIALVAGSMAQASTTPKLITCALQFYRVAQKASTGFLRPVTNSTARPYLYKTVKIRNDQDKVVSVLNPHIENYKNMDGDLVVSYTAAVRDTQGRSLYVTAVFSQKSCVTLVTGSFDSFESYETDLHEFSQGGW